MRAAGPIVDDNAMDRMYWPFAAAGLARTIASRNACRFSVSASAAKDFFPTGACTIPLLSTRNSILPALSSFTALATSIVTVPAFGFGIRPRGLMPNPKAGTVTMDVAKAVKELKAGKIEFRVDKSGIVHAPVGKKSFAAEALTENLQTFLEAIVRAKPAAAKGQYIRSITLSSTMGPGVRIDPAGYHQ